MNESANSAEALVPHLKKCGYADAQIAIPFFVDQAKIDVAAFAGKPWDNWSACVAVVNSEGDSKASAEKAKYLGAVSVFVCGRQGVDWYGLGPNGPFNPKPIKWADIGGVFREHKAELSPSRIYEAKLRKPGSQGNQLWFFDAGLMPAVEKNRGQTLLRLVENAAASMRSGLGERLKSDQDWEDVYRTVFWQLAAKILHDKRAPNFININLEDVDAVFERIGRHQGETGHLPPFGRRERPTIDAMAKSIANCGSLADVAPEAIADVYENALLDRTATKKLGRQGDGRVSIRKRLGIHGTPFVLINHMLSQIWGMIEGIACQDRYVFEPACGHAPFLTRAMRWMRQWDDAGAATTSHDYMRKHLRGIEKEPFSRELAKLALTLADEPHGNSWAIQPGDMFEPGVLAKEAKKTHILLSNPPYEAFTDADRRHYDKLGARVTANTKAVEMLKRTLPHLPPGGVFGVVMPVGVLHDKESKPVRKELLGDFDLSEIAVFADNLFEHGDHEVAVLMGRKKKPRTKLVALWYRRVREHGMEAFKERLSFSWEREVPQSRFAASDAVELRLPELDDLWAHLASGATLDNIATVAKGLDHKGKTRPKGCWTVRNKSALGGELGYANVDSDLQIYSLPTLVKLNLSSEAVRGYDSGRPTRKPQVLLNYARVARTPWKLKATLDEGGRALTSAFSAVRPRTGGPSVLYLWALLNSPVANAFAYSKMDGRHVRVGMMRRMPVPARLPSREAAIEQAALRYRQLATSAGPLFSGDSTPESIKRSLLEMDAAVLRAYDLPPRLERQLLDLFAGVERKGVGCDFLGYYPAGFTSALPLHMIISEQFERAAADKSADRFKPGESEYIREMLLAASVGNGEA